VLAFDQHNSEAGSLKQRLDVALSVTKFITIKLGQIDSIRQGGDTPITPAPLHRPLNPCLSTKLINHQSCESTLQIEYSLTRLSSF
jgi:hypothetical protein